LGKQLSLAEQFEQTLLERIKQGQALGVMQKRLEKNIAQYGALATAQRLLKRGELSEGYEALVALGRTDLTLEAVVAMGKFSELFSDDEVNACFDVLCADGFYR